MRKSNRIAHMNYFSSNRKIVFSLLGLFTMFFIVKIALADSNLDFTVHNETGYDITSVFCAPHSSTDWGDDVLGTKVLATGSSHDIKFSRSSENSSYDLRVEYSDGSSHTWENIDLSEITDLTLYYRDGKTTFKTKNGD